MNIWILNNMLLSMDQKGNQTENQKYHETNENESIILQNLCDAAKAVLKGKFIAKEAYLKKHKKFKIKKYNYILLETRNRKTNNTQISRKRK